MEIKKSPEVNHVIIVGSGTCGGFNILVEPGFLD